MAWLRLYDDIPDDPKVQSLPAETFKGWVNILCIANRYKGLLPKMAELAFHLRTSEAQTLQLVDELKRRGLIDDKDGQMMPHGWLNRQYQSDVSTDRVRHHREKKRGEKRGEKQHDTPFQSSSEVPFHETGDKRFTQQSEPVSRNAPEQNRTEQNRSSSSSNAHVRANIEPAQQPPAQQQQQPEPDKAAWDLAVELSGQHWIKGNPQLARAAIERKLAESSNPTTEAAIMRRRHAEWLPYYIRRARDRSVFKPTLDRWISEGDYLTTPPQDLEAREVIDPRLEAWAAKEDKRAKSA